ncbi:MAG: hypothetical protein NT069_34060 [Planctomycetota bacterium]|nr:hypothetical protein [Planctomycetota bacterium]
MIALRVRRAMLRNCLLTGWIVLVACASGAWADKLVHVAGGGTIGHGIPAASAKMTSPFGVDFDREGTMFIVELEGGHVHRVDTQGLFTTIGGTGAMGDSGDGGPAGDAVFHSMHTLAIAPDGVLYIADTLNHRVRKLEPRTGKVDAFAGTGAKGYAGDGGPAKEAQFNGVYCVAFTPDYKTLIVTDLENKRIRGVDMRTGIVHLIAGNGQKGVPPDGADAAASPLVDPRAAAADRDGNVYVLERGGHALRVVDPRGKIRTVVGTGMPGGTGDGGPALQATLRGPKHLCLDVDGNVLIADTDNHLIRRYLPATGRIERVAGTGKQGTAGLDGPPEQAELFHPHGVCFDSAGTLFIVDTGNNRILKRVRE